MQWHKETPRQCRSCRRCRLDPRIRKIPWRWKWQPAPVFIPRKFHGQRSLAGSWGLKELDWTHTDNHLYITRYMEASSKPSIGPSSAVQWLGLHASTTGGLGLTPDRGTRAACFSHSVMSDCNPWTSPGKNTGVWCHFLLQGSSQAGDGTWVSCTAGRFFTVWAIRKAGTLHGEAKTKTKKPRSTCQFSKVRTQGLMPV